MIIFYFFIIPMLYIPVKLILCFLVSKFGKFSYKDFSAVGFAYDAKKDLFYTTKNAWQRNFGYCHLYDVGAPVFRMIIDTEPVRFYYNNRNWLITFWKGQYGIVSGAEIGVYYTNEKIITKKTLYLPAKDKDMLDIDFTLYKNGEKITQFRDKHWWLAVFKLGMFSKPKQLTMDIKMTFPNKEMLNAFIKSFEKLGYKKKDYEIDGNTFKFVYKKPRTRRVWTRGFILDGIRQYWNRKNALIYNNYVADLIDYDIDNETYEYDEKKIIMLSNLIPKVLKNPKDVTKNRIFNDIDVSDIFYKEIEIDNESGNNNSITLLNNNVFSNTRKK